MEERNKVQTENIEAYEKFITKLLTSDDPSLDEMYWVETAETSLLFSDYPVINGPASKREILLARLTGNPYYMKLHKVNGLEYDEFFYTNKVTPVSKCTPEQIEKINQEKQRREQEKEKMEKSDDAEYDTPGRIRASYGIVPYLSSYSIENQEDWIDDFLVDKDMREKMGEPEEVVISGITKRQLIKSGLDSEKMGYKPIKKAQEKTKEEIETEEIKRILLYGDDEIGYVESECDLSSVYAARDKGMPEDFAKAISKSMPRKMFELGKKYGIGFPSDIRFITYGNDEIAYKNTFRKFDECGWEGEKAIIDRRKRLKAYQEEVLDSKNGEYDKIGIISIPKYKTNNLAFNTGGRYAKATVERYIEIEATQRELAEAGILPEDFKWREKPRITSKDISEADKEYALTTMEARKGKGIINRLRDFFKGKGEK